MEENSLRALDVELLDVLWKEEWVADNLEQGFDGSFEAWEDVDAVGYRVVVNTGVLGS